MMYVTKHIAAGSIVALTMFTSAVSASALDVGVYLDASTVPASLEELDSNLELRADATSSYPDDSGNRSETNTKHAASSLDLDAGSPFAQLWAFFTGLFGSAVVLQGTTTVSSTAPNMALANVSVKDVSATHATVTWSPSVFQSVKVYYATATPVLAASSTAYVSTLRFWKRDEVTLKKLIPGTTYFYRVVAQTNSGTTTTAEASFRTMEK